MLNDRFWSKVDRRSPADCWEWTANKNNKGYGLFRPGGTAPKRLAHRLAYEDSNGPIPHGRVICHHCDNPACVNPSHLFLGTMKSNYDDMVAKGRRRVVVNPNNKPPIFRGDDNWTRKYPEKVLRGEQVATSKIKTKDVLVIYQMRISGLSYQTIAAEFALDKSTVADICKGKRWSQVLLDPSAPSIEQLLSVPNATPKTKLQKTDIQPIRKMMADGLNNHQIAASFGVHHATISDIRRGVSWKQD